MGKYALSNTVVGKEINAWKELLEKGYVSYEPCRYDYMFDGY